MCMPSCRRRRSGSAPSRGRLTSECCKTSGVGGGTWVGRWAEWGVGNALVCGVCAAVRAAVRAAAGHRAHAAQCPAQALTCQMLGRRCRLAGSARTCPRRVAGLLPSASCLAGQRAYDLAAFRGHRQLLWALDPRVPLATLLQQTAARPAVPSLAALAAAALRCELAQQLRALVAAAAEARTAAGSGAVAGGADEGSRHSMRSSAHPSREGLSQGAAAPGATHAPALWAMARLSGGSGGGGARLGAPADGECPAACASVWQRRWPSRRGNARGAGAPHRRNASDSGIVLHAFQPAETAAGSGGGGSLSGSGRGGTAYATLVSRTQLVARLSGGPPLLLAAQPSGGGGPGGTLAEMAAVAGSILGCNTATSVTSAAGKTCVLEGKEISKLANHTAFLEFQDMNFKKSHTIHLWRAKLACLPAEVTLAEGSMHAATAAAACLVHPCGVARTMHASQHPCSHHPACALRPQAARCA